MKQKTHSGPKKFQVNVVSATASTYKSHLAKQNIQKIREISFIAIHANTITDRITATENTTFTFVIQTSVTHNHHVSLLGQNGETYLSLLTSSVHRQAHLITSYSEINTILYHARTGTSWFHNSMIATCCPLQDVIYNLVISKINHLL
jgi:hypothetical protein